MEMPWDTLPRWVSTVPRDQHSAYLESSREWQRKATQSCHYQENGHLRKKSHVKFREAEPKSTDERCSSNPAGTAPTPPRQ